MSESQSTALCPYCQSESEVAYRHSDQRMTACEQCGAWFVHPLPTRAAMIEHYDQNKAGMPAELREWRSNTSQEKWYELLAKRMARTARGEVASVVDVGAGGLELTNSLARAFPRAHVEAWDLFADGADPVIASDVVDRVALQQVDLNDLGEAPRASFDVVACVAVIEHVLDPLSLLGFLRSITAADGFAYIVGPEVTAGAHRLMGKSWPYYCPDEHLTLPSLLSIEKALTILGGGRYELGRVNVHYSLKYLLRFLRVPITIPAIADFLVPIPAGAFELVWKR